MCDVPLGSTHLQFLKGCQQCTAIYSNFNFVNTYSSHATSVKQASVFSKRLLGIPWLLASDRLDCIRSISI